MNATKERQAWCCLQVKLCDPCLSALCVPWCKTRYINTLPFLSFWSSVTLICGALEEHLLTYLLTYLPVTGSGGALQASAVGSGAKLWRSPCRFRTRLETYKAAPGVDFADIKFMFSEIFVGVRAIENPHNQIFVLVRTPDSHWIGAHD